MPEPTLVSVDLETAGTLMGATPIISIGACRVGRDWEAEWDRLEQVVALASAASGPHVEEDLFYCELRPREGAPWSPESVQFHGLQRTHLLQSGTHPVEALRRFADWVRSLPGAGEKVGLVSHNAAFDWAHLGAHFVHYGVDDPFDPFPVCTKNIARGIFRHRDEELSGQTALASVLGMPPHLGKHNALADALSQAVLYRKLMAHEQVTR